MLHTELEALLRSYQCRCEMDGVRQEKDLERLAEAKAQAMADNHLAPREILEKIGAEWDRRLHEKQKQVKSNTRRGAYAGEGMLYHGAGERADAEYMRTHSALVTGMLAAGRVHQPGPGEEGEE